MELVDGLINQRSHHWGGTTSCRGHHLANDTRIRLMRITGSSQPKPLIQSVRPPVTTGGSFHLETGYITFNNHRTILIYIPITSYNPIIYIYDKPIEWGRYNDLTRVINQLLSGMILQVDNTFKENQPTCINYIISTSIP